MIEPVVKRVVLKPFSAGVGYHVREAHKALTRSLADELARKGVALKHYYYLRALFEEDGITHIELGERVGMNRATVTRVVDTMMRAGLVRRVPDPYDRRKINLVLTPKAERLRVPLRNLVDEVNREALAGMTSAQAASLRDALRKIMNNLRTAAVPRRGNLGK